MAHQFGCAIFIRFILSLGLCYNNFHPTHTKALLYKKLILHIYLLTFIMNLKTKNIIFAQI